MQALFHFVLVFAWGLQSCNVAQDITKNMRPKPDLYPIIHATQMHM